MSGSDALLVLGAVIIVGFVALLVIVLRATARTAENAREILVALEEIHQRTGVLAELDGVSRTAGGTAQAVPDELAGRAGNGSGQGTEVSS